MMKIQLLVEPHSLNSPTIRTENVLRSWTAMLDLCCSTKRRWFAIALLYIPVADNFPHSHSRSAVPHFPSAETERWRKSFGWPIQVQWWFRKKMLECFRKCPTLLDKLDKIVWCHHFQVKHAMAIVYWHQLWRWRLSWENSMSWIISNFRLHN